MLILDGQRSLLTNAWKAIKNTSWNGIENIVSYSKISKSQREIMLHKLLSVFFSISLKIQCSLWPKNTVALKEKTSFSISKILKKN